MRVLARLTLAIFATSWIAAAAFAAGQSYQIKVSGLACPFCAYGIEKKLGAIKGVAHVTTNLKAGTVIVSMKDGAKLDRGDATQAVRDAGFTLHGFAQR